MAGLCEQDSERVKLFQVVNISSLYFGGTWFESRIGTPLILI
jgi:hypothetical protein